jgi:hypothetical protein
MDDSVDVAGLLLDLPVWRDGVSAGSLCWDSLFVDTFGLQVFTACGHAGKISIVQLSCSNISIPSFPYTIALSGS